MGIMHKLTIGGGRPPRGAVGPETPVLSCPMGQTLILDDHSNLSRPLILTDGLFHAGVFLKG